MNKKPLVTITCVAYNEADYIRRTLDGFVMQKTNFPFIALVHDDVSTDNTAEIIMEYAQKYPDIIVPIIDKENLFSQKKLESTMNQHIAKTECKYVAICEGDDWWIDPYKLQKQVDYMESHPDCVMCYTDCQFYYESNNSIDKTGISANVSRADSFSKQMIHALYLAPMTWLVKRELHGSYDNYTDNHFAMSLDLYQNGNVHFLPDITAVYCVRGGTVANQGDAKKVWRYVKGIHNTKLEYLEKYGAPKDLLQSVLIKDYMQVLPEAIEAGDHEFIKETQEYFKNNFDVDFFQLIDKWKMFIDYKRQYNQILSSKAYRLGKFLLKPFSYLKRMVKK